LVVALNETVPFPLPLAPAVTVSQPVAELLADHAHPVPTVTPTEPVAPAAPTDAAVPDNAGVQVVVMPGCVTVKVWPAIVAVPTRCVVVAFGATFTVTFPFPVPLPAAIVSQLALLVAVQAQLLPVATATTVASPAAGDMRVVGETA
jgi:hypothetical protein